MDLRNVKNQADQIKTQSGTELTYEQYCNLLLSAASAYDVSFAAKEAPSLQPKNRAVYLHDVAEADFYDAQEDMLTYDIDASVDMLQVHVHQQKPPPRPSRFSPAAMFPRMSKEKWFKLSPKAHEIWDQLDDRSKSIILAPPEKPPPNQARKINMHEISAYDYLMANFHLSMEDMDGDPTHVQSDLPDPAPPEDDGASDQVLVNAAEQSKPAPHPADI